MKQEQQVPKICCRDACDRPRYKKSSYCQEHYNDYHKNYRATTGNDYAAKWKKANPKRTKEYRERANNSYHARKQLVIDLQKQIEVLKLHQAKIDCGHCNSNFFETENVWNKIYEFKPPPGNIHTALINWKKQLIDKEIKHS